MEPDAIEQRVWDAIEDGWVFGDRRVALIEQIDKVIAWRTRTQGAAHPDLIWPLKLRIELPQEEYDLDLAREAAKFGERRLAIQRNALRDTPDELIEAIRTQARLYTFGDQTFDKRRSNELVLEVAAMEAAHGR